MYLKDKKTIALYLKGDPDVVKKLYSCVRRIINSILSKYERHGAVFSDRDNIIDDIIFCILEKDDHKVLRAYKARSKLSTYLWPIIRNKAVDNIRREHRYANRMTDCDPETLSYNPHHNVNPMALQIQEYLDREPALQRYIKYAKWLSGQNYEEIIQQVESEFALSLNTQRIAYILHSNRRKLQKKFKKYNVSNDK